MVNILRHFTDSDHAADTDGRFPVWNVSGVTIGSL